MHTVSAAVPAQVEDLETELRAVRHEWAEDIAGVRREAARATADAQAHAAQGNDMASAAAAEREATLSSDLHDQRAAFQVMPNLTGVPCVRFDDH